ncbi:MAG: PilZ domain-containing protein [Candidatus Eisenbacteria bacterium]
MSSVTTPEIAELHSILPVGSDVVLEWNAAFRVHGRVEAYAKESPARATVRIEPDEPNPSEGTSVSLRVAGEEARAWAGTVLGVDEGLVSLDLRPDPGNSRSFFRMSIRLTLRIFVGADERGVTTTQTIARVVELSGGGCRFVAAPDMVEPDSTYEARLQLEDDRTPLSICLKTLRKTPHADGVEFSATFLDLKEPDRQRILRRLFEEYRQLRRPESP